MVSVVLKPGIGNDVLCTVAMFCFTSWSSGFPLNHWYSGVSLNQAVGWRVCRTSNAMAFEIWLCPTKSYKQILTKDNWLSATSKNVRVLIAENLQW